LPLVSALPPSWSRGPTQYGGNEISQAKPGLKQQISIEPRGKIDSSEEEKKIVALSQEAERLIGAGDYHSAALIWEKVAAWAENNLDPEEVGFAQILNKLALIYMKQGFYEKAEPLLVKSLAIREKRLGLWHQEVALALNNLAYLHRSNGTPSKAESLYIRAANINEKLLGPEHPETVSVIFNLAAIYSDQGNYSMAKKLYSRVLAAREKLLGADHVDTASALNNLALAHEAEDEFDKAELLYTKALEIHIKRLGPEHAEVAVNLNNLGFLYIRQGEYAKAEKMLAQAIKIKETVYGINHASTSASMNVLGQLYAKKGEYKKAEQLIAKSLSVREKILGPRHLDTAQSLSALASLYSDIGSYEKAEKLFARSQAIFEQTLGLNHSETVTSLNNQGILYFRQGRYEESRRFFEKVLSADRKIFGPNHSKTAVSINNLASAYQAQGLYDKALKLLEEYLDIIEKSEGPTTPNFVTGVNNLASLYWETGALKKAEAAYIKALNASRSSLGESHPLTVIITNSLGGVYWEESDIDQGYSYLNTGIRTELEIIQREAPHLPRRERSGFLHSLGNAYISLYSKAKHGATGASLSMLTRLNRHGLLEDIEKRQSQLARLPGPQQRAAQQLRDLNTQLSSATLQHEERQTLRIKQEELERVLYRLIPELKPNIIEVSQIAAELPARSALIEFQRYQLFNSHERKDQRWGDSYYLALILASNGDITPIQLGLAVPIESAIHKALNASTKNTSDVEKLWHHVSMLVLQPIAPTLKGITQLFIAPDSELNRVPFAALPSPQDPNKPLAQAVQLRMLTTGRDLLRLRQSSKAAQAPVVVANPNFDRGDRPNTSIATINSGNEPQHRSADLATKSWAPLPSSEREGELISSLLATRPITRNDATTTRLQQLKSPRVLHIASHGFFVADVQKTSNNPLHALQDQSAMLGSFRGEDPQLHSGLVLAGANQPEADPNDDGYLTAAEAVSLELDGTELVVLSACSTGQGDVRTGEGVYGLQRSLTVAGARSTLLSLWKVDDDATAEFMTRFYKRLKAGEGRSDALAAVQEEFRSGKVQSANGLSWKEPYYWAAWQLVGDWRPIPDL
jgi:tetratricopeptide (TPR) repeat protein